jgi:hypothetical protein
MPVAPHAPLLAIFSEPAFMSSPHHRLLRCKAGLSVPFLVGEILFKYITNQGDMGLKCHNVLC